MVGRDNIWHFFAYFQPGEENVAFKELTDQLNKISYAGDKISVTKGFDPTALLPGKISHFSNRCFKKLFALNALVSQVTAFQGKLDI